MKRFFALLAALIMILAMLAGCSPEKEPPQPPAATDTDKTGAAISVMDVLGDDMLALYENRNAKLPAAVIYVYQGNGERVESPLYGEDGVNTVLDAIAVLTVAGETDMAVTDSDSCYTFINADGTEAGSVSFNGGFLDRGDKKYEVQNTEALTRIDFPAETNRDALTLDGPDPKMVEFLERCKTEAPVSIRVVRDASQYEITGAEAIGEAVNALHSIGLTMYALQGAEPPATTLTATFVMQDGWEYSLTFYDESIYIYSYPEPLGVWSFYTDGAAYFIDALEKAE